MSRQTVVGFLRIGDYMAQEQGPMSGFRDLLAEQMIPREEVLNTIRSTMELYGFVPLKTPALELLSTLTGKYGDEGDKLMYTFKDNGGRDVAMRYDQTVPLARVVAQYGDLPKPYKRYAVGDVWRGERPQAGRYREFLQFDADIVGTNSYLADTEIIAMMSDSMSAIGLESTVRVNDRGLLDALATECGIEGKDGFYKLVGLIDKVEKIGVEAVLEEFRGEFGKEQAALIGQYLTIAGSNTQKIEAIRKLLKNETTINAVDNLTKIFGTLALAGYGDNIVFDQTIARGLNYYTGTIYETTLNQVPEIGSVCSGGRFDTLIEQLGGPNTPAVGTSVGVDRLMEAMRKLGLVRDVKTNTEVYITNVESGLDPQRFALAQDLRRKGIATEMVYDDQKLGKQIAKIDRLGVGRIVILGSQELDSDVVVVKDLASGDQLKISKDKIAEELRKS